MSFLNTNKVLHHPQRYAEWYSSGDTTAPVTVKIDLTNVCNHDCPGCIDHDLIDNDNNHLSYDIFETLLPDLKAAGVKGINYTGGGEPTVHKEFDKIVRLTNELGLEIGLICNGSRFHSWPMEELLKMFTWIRVSLDSYDKKTHIRTHGLTARFEKTVKNIELLVDIKRKQSLDTILGAGYITNQHADMDRNVHRFIEVCKDAGIDYAQLRPSFGFMYDYSTIPSDEWERIFDSLIKYETDDFKIYIDRGKFQKILSGKPLSRNYQWCHAQSFKSTSITADGGVYICCSLSGDKRGLIGNIKNERFKDIWMGNQRKDTLNNLDVAKCPHLCVGDNLNEFLDEIRKRKVMHPNFL